MARRKKGWTAREKFIFTVALLLIVAISGAFFVFDGAVDEFRKTLGLSTSPSPSVSPSVTPSTSYVQRYTYDVVDLAYDTPAGALLDVHFVDVLQGDAVFIELPDGKTMLIDAGRHDTTSTATAELVAYLTAEGLDDNGLDYLVLTHSDADHVGGMNEILEAFAVRNVYMPKLVFDNTEPYEPGSIGTVTFQEFTEAVANENGVSVTYTTQENEDELSIVGTDYSLTFYCPPESYYDGVTKDSNAEVKNNMSCVIILEYAERRILLTGDLHSEAEGDDFPWSEAHLVDRIGGTGLDVDVYKLGHHGSHSSSSTELLEFFDPEVAVACVGDASDSADKNSYSHPRPEALNRLVKAGCNFLFRTDRHGTVVLSVGENGGMRFATELDCAFVTP